MQIIAGRMLRTTLAIVLPNTFILALSLKCLDAFQSMLMNTTLADNFVLRGNGVSGLSSVAAVIPTGLSSVAAVFRHVGLAAAIWEAEGMRAMQERQY